jgi:serine phosphatase RsbU (regulator of sigma subunit)/PAS domain-containing protein
VTSGAQEHDAPRQAAGSRYPFGRAVNGGAGRRPDKPDHQPGDVPALDRLAELAATLLNVAGGAYVALPADGRVVLGGVSRSTEPESRAGVDASSAWRMTFASTLPAVVLDAGTDPRVEHVSALTSSRVGAWISVPVTSGGETVAALCVVEPEPRAWTEHEVEVLALLTEQVRAEIERAAADAQHDEDRLLWGLAVDAAGVGVFDWDLRTDDLRWDERLLEVFGLDRDSFGGTIEAFNAMVHPEDRGRVTEALDGAIRSCGPYEAEYRVVLPSGATRWVSARGLALPGPHGRAARLLGAAFDSTVVRDGEARVARILEAMPSAFFHLDPQWRFTYANAEAERLLGGIGTGVVGHIIWELFPAAVGTEFETSYRQAVATQEPVSFEAYYPPPLDDWYDVRAWPTPDGLSVYFLDITARREAEEVVEQAAASSALLAQVTRTLTDTLDAEEGVAGLSRLLVPSLSDWCVVTLVDGDTGSGAGWRHHLRDIGTWHTDPEARPLVARYAETRIRDLSDGSFLARSLRLGEPVLIPTGAAEAIAAVLEPGEARDLCHELAPSSAVVVPLRGRGRTNGLLTVFRGHERPPFSAAEVDTLCDVAGRAGLALDNSRAYAEQRDLAEGLQRSLLTPPPQPDHLEVVVRYEPAAEAAQVGGDWYDSFLQVDGVTTVVIGDVVGHDTAAAAAMGQVRSLLRGIAVTTGDLPAGVLGRVDEAMSVLQVDTTATVVVARFEQDDHERAQGVTRLRWSNAGHPPPVLVTEPGATGVATVEELWAEETDLLLGLDPGSARTESVVTLTRGATVLLYTDGLVEHRAQTLDEGLAKLRTVLTEMAAEQHTLDELCDRVLLSMLAERPDDDVAIVAVRLHREDRPRPDGARTSTS